MTEIFTQVVIVAGLCQYPAIPISRYPNIPLSHYPAIPRSRDPAFLTIYLLFNNLIFYLVTDVRYFPFDQQKCMMKFGSWTFSSSQVQMGLLDDKVR